jgi:hypothetical protein
MFMVPPGRGAISGPSGPASSAAARAVPSPATTSTASGAPSITLRRQSMSSPGSGAWTTPETPYSASSRSAICGASGPTDPEAMLATMSMRFTRSPFSSRLGEATGVAVLWFRFRTEPPPVGVVCSTRGQDLERRAKMKMTMIALMGVGVLASACTSTGNVERNAAGGAAIGAWLAR